MPSESERREFVDWLHQSPIHIRELLAAKAWDHILDTMMDPERKISIDALCKAAVLHTVALQQVEVVAIASDQGQKTPLLWLEALAKLVSKSAYEAFLESVVLEARVEHHRGVSSGDDSAARWALLRCYATILKPLRVAAWASLKLWLRRK